MNAPSARWHLARTRWSLDPWTLAAVPIALLLAWLFATREMLVELAALAVLALPLLLSPRVRVVFVVFGTATVFGAEELNTSKLLFVLGVIVAGAGAFARSRALTRTAAYDDLKPLFVASVGLILLLALSLPVSQFNGVSGKDWFRDIAPYVLLALAPLFAFDAQTAFTSRALRVLTALVGLETAIFFMVRWYGRRDIAADVTSGQFGLPSFLLAGAVFALAMAIALDGERGRARWLGLGAAVLAMMVSTGTRLSAVLLAAPLAVVVGTRRSLARRSVRLAIALPIAAVLVVLGARATLGLVDANAQVVTARYELLFATGTGADDSYRERLNQTTSAWELFRSEPLFGVGPGYRIPWSDVTGRRFAEPTVDSPVAFLSDYGLLGLLVAVLLAGGFVSVVRRLRRRTGGRTTMQLALIGFGAIVLAFSVAVVPFEDKGLSAGLILLLSLAAREAAEHERGALAR